ncbi:hypothetical protein [Mangrovimonas sp. DI 80]|uniref:hypothetical protein n=1 Tax=Mangrovimonas sp. DI 80 TaxID=1779330 RepID=UPI00097860B7|nr:hypothetical protein [Mangrovimonas sp. DI 80]OMP32265.1 hypothetical protein BKM32_04225 [Mangrovimonas sp. DI 80]
MEKSLRIKLYGESFKIHKLKIDDKDYRKCQSVAEILKQPLEMALINIDFFRLLNHPDLSSINDFIEKTFGGLINNPKNSIEITWGRKRVAKFTINDLLFSNTLFPLYNANIYQVDTENMLSGIYLMEREIGLIGQYETVASNFKFDHLQFHLTKSNFQNTALELLNFVTFNGSRMHISKTDCLLRHQQAFTCK